jgi:uncharacterized membrane protein
MKDILVIAFSDEQTRKELVAKPLSMQKQGQIDIKAAVVALKMANGELKLKQLSNASPFWKIRAAASGYPAPPVGGALTDFNANDKFVKELAEAIPLSEVTVFISKENASR